ncbi:fasciclin domain-containing protein [Plebeiibacterium sediminum]|uniref:Fasciclin domain-containing protein n=1 Tax=Plebeiibacterium sediminum TaxID=2992112 RepID=A0AAE3M540_9BACT|nr:fasciclin domain-containing protein [Plebeiobacterium sediminum]MCW3787002.1 fasciclin domain-containing protein [Plebeiobacterium sediminum]
MKKNINLRYKTSAILGFAIIFALVVFSCEPYEITYETSSDQLMGEYIESNADCSIFWNLAETTGNASFIKAYGTYTCFVPTNDAFETYFTEQGKSALTDFSEEELENIFKYHIINDTIRTQDFTDGKMRTSSMNGRYITTGASIQGTDAYYTINKKSLVTDADIMLGNGIVHKVNAVLDPPVKTVAELIVENDAYSIFSQALQTTGIYDTLMIADNWYTVFVESDEVYARENVNINSYDDLYNKYCNTGDPTDPADSLYLYMAYHCFKDCSYMADLIQKSATVTMAPNEVVTITDKSDSIIINQTTIAGTTYPGANIKEENSDNICYNGVFHELDDDIYIRVLSPTAVFWDPTRQPEIEALTGIYKDKIETITFASDDLANVSWGEPSRWSTIAYQGDGNCIDGDMLSIYLRTAVVPWIEFKTPVLIKGTYKLWVAYRRYGYGNTIQTSWNGEELTKLFDPSVWGQTYNNIDEDEYYALGYKWYTELNMSSSRVCCVYLGKIEVTSTGEQTLRFEALTNGRGYFWLDQIQFIPVDDDQLWPKFDSEGNKLYEEDLPDYYGGIEALAE